MQSKIGGSDCEGSSTKGVDDNDVINTPFAVQVSCVVGGTMAASDVKVSLVSSLLLRKALIESCTVVGSRGCCSSSRLFSSSIAFL